MSVPTHGLSCQTKLYPTNCWTCKASIHVLQCTCGSAVLFDSLGPDWEQHECWTDRGIGGSGLKGWQAIDALRSMGAPISADVMNKIFPSGPTASSAVDPASVKSVSPKPGRAISLLAVVREYATKTQRIDATEGLTEIARRLLRLPQSHYRQVTLVVNSERPNLSYTCLVPEALCSRSWGKGTFVFTTIDPRVAGTFALWLVTAIHPI